MLQQRVLCPPGDPTNKAAGLLYHLADIYVPELRNCAAPPADAAAANGEGDGSLCWYSRLGFAIVLFSNACCVD